MKPYQAVLLIWILSAFIGYGFGAVGTSKWLDILAALILALAGTRWIGILRRKNVVEDI